MSNFLYSRKVYIVSCFSDFSPYRRPSLQTPTTASVRTTQRTLSLCTLHTTAVYLRYRHQLQPQFVPHREHCLCVPCTQPQCTFVTDNYSLSSYRTENTVSVYLVQNRSVPSLQTTTKASVRTAQRTLSLCTLHTTAVYLRYRQQLQPQFIPHREHCLCVPCTEPQCTFVTGNNYSLSSYRTEKTVSITRKFTLT